MTIIISHFQARLLLDGRKASQTQVNTTPDLGLTTVAVTLNSDGVVYPDDVQLSWAQVDEIDDDENSCFVIENDGLRKIQAFSQVTNRHSSLYPTSGAPTLLLAGWPMHRIKDTDPMRDTQSKIRALGRIHGQVLDTNTGLGYTAIALSQAADHVTTIEIDPTVLDVARQNPYSRELFDNPRIAQIIGDSDDVIQDFDDESFDCVLHDPPTMQLAGNLYAADFYQDVYRVLRRGGRMFHYIGDPKSPYGSRTTKGVVKRLGEAGFKKVQSRPQAFGVLAFK